MLTSLENRDSPFCAGGPRRLGGRLHLRRRLLDHVPGGEEAAGPADGPHGGLLHGPGALQEHPDRGLPDPGGRLLRRALRGGPGLAPGQGAQHQGHRHRQGLLHGLRHSRRRQDRGPEVPTEGLCEAAGPGHQRQERRHQVVDSVFKFFQKKYA